MVQQPTVAAVINAPSPPPCSGPSNELCGAVRPLRMHCRLWRAHRVEPALLRLIANRCPPERVVELVVECSGGGAGRRLSSGLQRPTLSGGGLSRLFDVRGTLRLEGVDLTNGRARQGGLVFVYNGGDATLTDVDLTDSIAVGSIDASGHGDANGGCAHVDPGGSLTIINGLLKSCSALHTDALAGIAHGGGVFSSGSLTLTSSRVENCTARSAFASGGQGGGAFIATGAARLFNGTTLADNSVSGTGEASS